MAISNKPIPAGYHTATPYLFVRDAVRAIEFYKQAFGATELVRLPTPAGKIGHAEIKIGDSVIMLAEEVVADGFASPLSLGGAGASIFLYVEDVDAVFNRAITAGATTLLPVTDQFYGDRVGTLKDPFGHMWSIATHKEDLTPEELGKRAAEFYGRGASG